MSIFLVETIILFHDRFYGEWIYFVDFSTIFFKGDYLCDFLFASKHTKALLKRVYFKRKEFAPKGSKFFPFTVDPLCRGGVGVKTIFHRIASNKSASIPYIKKKPIGT